MGRSLLRTHTSTVTSIHSPTSNCPVTTHLEHPPSPALEVICMARTRIPTLYGPAFLHLYHNNRDSKEHLAIVIDPAQLSNNSTTLSAPPIRSRSLNAAWNENETVMDRITRGATNDKYTPAPSFRRDGGFWGDMPPPLVRIHSECFTGETVGSMRCDCGEQLDEAMRLIFEPVTFKPRTSSETVTIPGRGAIIYLRQEGRGIGLLSKMRAYNLQDMGHDTVTANLMLGHKADEREYEIAGAILRDLRLGAAGGEGVQVLTNNPEKVHALKKQGLQVVRRIGMVPRSWQGERGEGIVHGDDLDKYLRTKITRMGHLLPL